MEIEPNYTSEINIASTSQSLQDDSDKITTQSPTHGEVQAGSISRQTDNDDIRTESLFPNDNTETSTKSLSPQDDTAGIRADTMSQLVVNSEIDQTNQQKKSPTCLLCGKSFRWNTELTRHMRYVILVHKLIA